MWWRPPGEPLDLDDADIAAAATATAAHAGVFTTKPSVP